MQCTTRTPDGRDVSIAASSPRAEQTSEQLASQEEPPPDLMYPVNAFIDAAASHQGNSDIYHEAVHQPNPLSNFFEQIMVTQSDFLATEYLHPAPDLTAWLPETDWLGQVDLFGADFVPAIDETFNTPLLEAGRVGAATTPGGTAINEARVTNSCDAVRRRHALFKQSPWFWVPERNQNAFSEQEGITLDERQVDLALSPHQPYTSNVIIPGRLSQQSRDQVLQLVLKTAPSQISISSFPSADCLDKLVKVGIAKRTEGDAWIHPYTFDADAARPEFLTALVVAGCICFGIPSVNKTGLVLQEIVRVSLRELAERDNSAMRELQYLQASMLWIDIGAFCGFRRKMELAESSLQVLVTSLRRAGRFDDVRYSTVMPAPDDDFEALNTKWHRWIELEAYKRLVYHLFEHDIYMTMVNHRQPLLSYAELTLPLPASEALWLAPSAATWKARILDEPPHSFRPSLRSILQESGSISCLHASYDPRIARSAYIHGLASQIWEHRQQTVLLHEMSDPSSQLWSRSRQQKLQESLRNINIALDSSSALICVFQQFLQMYLYADLDAITRFAGRCGEEAAHRAYIALQPWSKSREARIAVGT
ncbi:c6 transcription factor [Pyrenophora seminiperda CCB06]|uniref:C6 transcription factor n=1 Tax=Pyrenophora seminiperda CCB06 TaxID=1302712 RepID=A0A3M7MBY3_9PLEO|nr:c6 transcription factor [Pyrenophora seminiperda CCB06]